MGELSRAETWWDNLSDDRKIQIHKWITEKGKQKTPEVFEGQLEIGDTPPEPPPTPGNRIRIVRAHPPRKGL